jgi:hypothetical protein
MVRFVNLDYRVFMKKNYVMFLKLLLQFGHRQTRAQIRALH